MRVGITLDKMITNTTYDHHRDLKKLIWLYFFLLLFEGALRRWFFPSLSDVLLVVRDPIAIWIIYGAWKCNRFAPNGYVETSCIIGFISFLTTMVVGHGNLWVAIYGLRILWIYFPLIFAIGGIFNQEDVIRMSKAILLISIPMTILIVIQFYSPQEAWINRGVGGSLEGAGFGGAMGFFRPPGTFSFIIGTATFYGLHACAVCYFWYNSFLIKKWLLITATFCLLCSIPFSISRTLFFHVIATFIFALLCVSKDFNRFKKLITVCPVLLLFFLLIKDVPFFFTSIEVFTERFTDASDTEGGAIQGTIGNRFFGAIFRGIDDASQVSFWGHGLGMGTNVGSAILTGDRAFLIKEEEWGRVVGEMGPLLGLACLFVRIALCFKIFISTYQQMKKGNSLPWILASLALPLIAQGQIAQPTLLGFMALAGGLVFAAARESKY